MIRLLTRESGEFRLVEFPDHDSVQYVILSHTWHPNNEEEVKYSDIIEKKGRDKLGYQKLRFCADQAARDGYLYFWVDTCCINKGIGPEVDEAIRSMHRWYETAAKCYVYLSDVPHPDIPTSTVESAFPNSRWFERGWTLQELIAPKIVEFYSRHGDHVGDKQSRLQQLHGITNIDMRSLQGAPLSSFSVTDRMSWADKRQTTRQEDAAYCLLGIFGIHMPVMYGEGKQHAMDRLYEEIRKSIRPAGSLDKLWIVPFERNRRFTGREAELAQLQHNLFTEKGPRKIAITGLGGIGKTQLVLELLHRVRQKQKNCLVMWIPVTSAESVHQGYLAVAKQLQIAGWDSKDTDVKQLVQEYLSQYDHGPWLLVFDNADDLDLWTGKQPMDNESRKRTHSEINSLIDYLPQSKHGCVIFTTRDRKTAFSLARENVVEVFEMGLESATNLLRTCLLKPDLVDAMEDTQGLLTQLTCLPLAIVQAAAYISENGISIAEYLRLLTEKEEDFIEALSQDFDDDGRYREVNNPVASTWLISFDQIRRRDALAAEYLSIIACVEPVDIPSALLPPGPSRIKQTSALGTLAAYSFVGRRSAEDMLDMHRLVHLATRNWLRKAGSLAEWTEIAMRRLQELFPEDDESHQNRAIWRAYLPHADYLLQSDAVDKNSKVRLDLAFEYGACLCDEGRWNEAEPIFLEICKTHESLFGSAHPSTLRAMSWIVHIYQKQGRWEEAEQSAVLLTETRKTILGADHRDTLRIMSILATIYKYQGRWTDAEMLEVQVLEMLRVKLADNHSDIVDSMGNLASIYISQGRWKEAEQLNIQALELRKIKLGADHPKSLINMSNLALIYGKQGRWREAERLNMQVLELSKIKLGADHPSTLTTMSNLTITYEKQGRWKEAEQLNIQALELRKIKLGADHPKTLINMSNLALIYGKQGRWKEAERLNMQVLELSKLKLGADHPDTLTSISILAYTHSKQGRWKEAEQLNIQVLELRKIKLGANHPDTLESMHNLADVWKHSGKHREALALMHDCIEASTRKLGPRHPETILSVESYDSWKAEFSA